MGQNEYAVIAGGSKGIGYAIAEALAKRNYHLLLIARHTDALTAAKSNLEMLHPIHVEILTLDLTSEAAANHVGAFCSAKNLKVKILCNVAGIGGAKDYLSKSTEEMRMMLHLNIESVISLTASLLPHLEANAPAFIMNVASLAGFAPIPIKNLYSASKSAVIFFSYSLHYQLKAKQVNVTCLCPGPVATKDEIVQDTIHKLGSLGKQMMLDPEKVGEIAVRYMLKGRLIIVPGFLARIFSVLLRTLPRRLLVLIYFKMGKQ